MPKGPYRGKPNEKQGPKTHQEDWRARKVQRNKCKWKQSTAKRKSAAEYRSVVEYRSATEYSSLAEWLRQIKINWAQDPFSNPFVYRSIAKLKSAIEYRSAA